MDEKEKKQIKEIKWRKGKFGHLYDKSLSTTVATKRRRRRQLGREDEGERRYMKTPNYYRECNSPS